MRDVLCTAVAYDWLVDSPDAYERDFCLVIGSSRIELDPGSNPQTSCKSYHLSFKPSDIPYRVDDVSGNHGLLWKTNERFAKEKLSTFERALADLIGWTLSNMEFDVSKRDHIVMVQGPLIPKLRGRYLYRGFDSKVPIYSVTFQPEWLPQSSVRFWSSEMDSSCNETRMTGVHPPTAIDSSTRSWWCQLPKSQYGNRVLHFEVIANMWDHGNKLGFGTWVEDRQKEIEKLISSGNLEPVGMHTDLVLPRALALALDAVRNEKRFEESFSEAYGFARKCIEKDGISLSKEQIDAAVRLFGDGFDIRGVCTRQEDLQLSLEGQEAKDLDCDECYCEMRALWNQLGSDDVIKELSRFLGEDASLQIAGAAMNSLGSNSDVRSNDSGKPLIHRVTSRSEIERFLHDQSQVLNPNVRREFFEFVPGITNQLANCDREKRIEILEDVRMRVRNESTLIWNNMKRDSLAKWFNRKWGLR